MKKHRSGTEPREVPFRNDSILRLAESKHAVKYSNLIIAKTGLNILSVSVL